ncbi:MAG: polyphenol oxidase family protein [Solirubrobacterales bacterium]
MKRCSSSGVDWYEAALPGAIVCFTTRRGGVSGAPYDALNLGLHTADDRGSVLENRALAATALDLSGDRIRMGLQVHSSEILEHENPEGRGDYLAPVANPPEADGHLTRSAGIPLLVLVADCLPVAVKGPDGLAMLHCGWRGLAGTLVQDAVAKVDAESAVIGPGIGPCCFEVGDEVHRAFASLGSGIFEGRMCDLPEVAFRLLRGAGVKQIETAGICTFCNEDYFFSHRRDGGVTGRQAGIAWIN